MGINSASCTSNRHVEGGTVLLKPALNENSKSGNQMIKIIPANKTPPKPYFIIALRFSPRGVGNFYKI